METAAVPAPKAAPPVLQLTYTGASGTLFGLWALNWLLVIVTFGVYHFWAKTKLRRFFHEHTFFLNEPFTYLGTGSEIFKSALKFMVLVVLPLALLTIGISLALQNSPFVIIAPIFYAVIFFIIKLYATLSGMRYRANRMSYRGLRFALKVKKGDYLRLLLKVGLFNIITLGLYRPYGDARFLQLFINNLAYGSQHFSYDGDKRELTRGYWLYWILVPFTLGASLYWYRAKLYRHIAKSTRLGTTEFRYNITGGQLFWLAFSNAWILMLSLGLLGFITMQRSMGLFVATLRLRHEPDFAAIKKAALEADGAGAADYLGADEDFGL